MNSAGKQLPRNAVPDGQRLPEPLLVRGDGPAEDAGPVRVALEGDHLVPHDLRRIFHWQVDERLAVLELDDVRERRPVGDLAEADPAGAAAAGAAGAAGLEPKLKPMVLFEMCDKNENVGRVSVQGIVEVY